MFVLDTNVASELMRPEPAMSVAAWIAGRDAREIDSAAARAYAEIAAERRRSGRPIGEADCQIAAISWSRGAVLITRNVRDFEGTGLNVIDPWSAQNPSTP